MDETRCSVRTTHAKHGVYAYPANDAYVGKSLELYGEWSEGEVDVIQRLTKLGDCVVEVGSNIGSHTVAMSRAVGATGKVIAFEPQRLIFQILCSNLIGNEAFNVWAYNIAVGMSKSRIVVPEIDIDSVYNFGGVRVGSKSGSVVPLVNLDSLELERLDFLKIDAEDCEPQVLLGAYETIRKYRPSMLIEYNTHMQEKINRVLRIFDYRAWVYNENLYNPCNFKGNTKNVFGNFASFNLILSCEPIAGLTDRLQEIKL